jgi:hypothetical protein
MYIVIIIITEAMLVIAGNQLPNLTPKKSSQTPE